MSRRSNHLTAWIAAVACLAAAVLFARPPQLRAAEGMSCAGVSLPMKQQAFGVDLVLNGMGLRTVSFLSIRIWVGGLYVERRTKNPAEILSRERSKILVMTSLKDADREQMIENIRNSMNSQPARVRKMVQANMLDLERRLPGPRKGGRLMFVYGQGRLELRQNGKVLGGWDDPGLAEGLFTTWLGNEPVDSDLKAGLLGGECD
ncbi:MAG TPA: chalcone isomerase family protein [Polyangiales bacterium]|nr:chalcone isomerase family protein [Polyangiales bacterium]